ncbi:MAG TPA: DUF87 domain-containing protein [Gammaproteobacteria bacterium]|jgi:hypothetical protein
MSQRKNIIQIGDVLPTKEQPKRLPCNLDLDRFLVTRALVQAESGGGKSWLLRRLAEQCYSFLPPIIIDPEGEFASLREKDDYIICAPSGADAVANTQTASLLAIKILETGVAAVIDIFEMSPDEQRVFVQRFFDALTNAPKKLWTPRLVILDEVQLFAQEGDKGACSTAVANASTRWRKRGFVLVGATQRIANVSKDVSAGLKNKFIGGTSQDIDVARAARELGMRNIHDATEALRRLEPGEFYCYGPALSHDVRKIAIGPVETSHPESGKKRLKAPPPPSKKIKELLASLADLPKEAETEARTANELKALVKQKDIRIRELEKAQPAPAAPAKTEVKTVKVPVITDAQLKRLESLVGRIEAEAKRQEENRLIYSGDMKIIIAGVRDSMREISAAQKVPTAAASIQVTVPARAVSVERTADVSHLVTPADGLTGPEQRILDAIAWLNSIGISEPEQAAVAFVAGYAVTGGAYRNPRSALKTRGLLEIRGDKIVLTTNGSAVASQPDASLTNAELHRRVLERLPGPEAKILKVLLERHPESVSNEDLAKATNYEATGGAYRNPRSRLKTLELIEIQGGSIRARDILFPVGRR